MAIKRLSIRISEELHEFLRKEAEREGLSINAVIIFGLNNYKDQKTVVPNIGVMQELLERIEKEEEMQRRGLID
ncbi:ParD-like family protein [Streptococcus mutans]|nr:ParD-like family protein [Streptococcus mutans]MCB5031979.1 ParD-like family protein [Streptococcus mutans]